jgi:hypothetical protein
MNAAEWTPRALRHSFVSLLSDSCIPVEEISRLVGHKSTVVTEAPGGRPRVPCLAPQGRRVTEDFLCLGRGVGDAHSGSSHRGVQTARRRTKQMVTAISSIESASSQPLSIHWNGQNRLAGW